MISLKTWTHGAITIEGLDTHDEFTEERGEPIEDLLTIPLHDSNPHHAVHIGSRLEEPLKWQLINFLWKNANVFVWSPIDRPGIGFEVMVHQLEVDHLH